MIAVTEVALWRKNYNVVLSTKDRCFRLPAGNAGLFLVTMFPMTSLKELLVGNRFDAAVADMANFITTTVDKQSGLTGMALKGALSTATKFDSDIVAKGSRRVMPEMAEGLDPLWQEYTTGGGTDFGAHLVDNKDRAMDAILSVADRNSDTINIPGVSKMYGTLRGKAAKVVEQELPTIGQLVEKHAR